MSAAFDYRVPAIAGCALFMELLDATAVLTALPQMATDFGEPALRMNLVVSLYLLAAAVLVPASGWAADRYGPRRVFLVAIALFTCASLACALSGSLLQLSLARLAQGAGGAMMVPVGQVILLRWASRDNLLRAMSFLTAPALLGPVIGPPLGGVLVTYAAWQWIFLINLPIGVLGLWLVWRYIPDYPPGEAGPFDARGLLLSAASLACLVFAFEALGHGLLEALPIVGLVVAGALFAWLYVVHARRCERPLLDLTLLRIPTFSIAIWGGNVFRLGSGALPFLLVLLFQLGFGLSPLAAGLLTFAGGAGALAIKFVAAPIVQRFGFRQTLVGNACLCGLSIIGCAVFRADTPYLVMVGVLFFGGVARSLQMSTLGALTYADVPSALSSRASSLAAMTMQLSLSLSVGVAATVLGVVQRWRGESVATVESIVVVVVFSGVVCGASVVVFRRLRAGVGL